MHVSVARRIAAALAILVVGYGCARSGAQRAGKRNAWTVPGVVRLGEDEEPDTLNLMYSHTAAADTIAGLLFSFVLRYDAAGQYIPDLATEVPTLRNGGISPDGKRIVVHLRRGVAWADGQTINFGRIGSSHTGPSIIRRTTSRPATVGTPSRRQPHPIPTPS